MSTNLPAETIEDSAAATKLYFERYGEQALEFPANDVALAVSFFERAGFDSDAAGTVATRAPTLAFLADCTALAFAGRHRLTRRPDRHRIACLRCEKIWSANKAVLKSGL